MEGKINFNGGLELLRKREYVEQDCPFSNPNEDGIKRVCGTWCPLFSEPENDTTGLTIVKLCHGKRLVFLKFEDQRE